MEFGTAPLSFAYSDCRGVTESALCRKAESCDGDRLNRGCSHYPGARDVKSAGAVIVTNPWCPALLSSVNRWPQTNQEMVDGFARNQINQSG